MVKKIVIVFFILISQKNWAQQNLVPNYSFEDYSSCPPQGNGIAYCMPWFQPNYPYAGINGSSDVQHACGGYVPQNSFTFQYARTGSGYAGIQLFVGPGIYEDDWREYIEVELTDSLKTNEKYCIRFYANKSNYSSYAIKQIQAVLTNDSLLYEDTNYVYIPNVTPVLQADSIIKDTLNWIPIQTVYTSNGGERFLTIGNFSPGNQVDYLYPWPTSSGYLGYYHFDDVSVYELPDYDAGNDTTICPWDTIVIGPQNLRGDVEYSWSPAAGLDNINVPNPNASPLVTTTYFLTVKDTCQWACNSLLTDSITIMVQGCLEVEELEIGNWKFEIYPNPASEKIIIETDIPIGYLQITDIAGKIINQIKLTQRKTEIQTDFLSNGTYFVSLADDHKIYTTKRIVISR